MPGHRPPKCGCCGRGSSSSSSSGSSSSSSSELTPTTTCSNSIVHYVYQLVVPLGDTTAHGHDCAALCQGVFDLGSAITWSNGSGSQCGFASCNFFSLDSATGPTGISTEGGPTYNRLRVSSSSPCALSGAVSCSGSGSQTSDVWQLSINPGFTSRLWSPAAALFSGNDYTFASTPSTGTITSLTLSTASPASGFPSSLTVTAGGFP